MPVVAPESIRTAWGDKAVADLAPGLKPLFKNKQSAETSTEKYYRGWTYWSTM